MRLKEYMTLDGSSLDARRAAMRAAQHTARVEELKYALRV